MTPLAWMVLLGPLLLFGYTYLGYPLILAWIARLRPRRPLQPNPKEWPALSICLPAHNEEAQIRGAIESLLALDYPVDRRQILVISDASSDRTDEIVREYADRGVELLRMPHRGGKTAAENAAAAHLRGEIVVNTDASVRILPNALKPLIVPFQDPVVGVASGRDVSISRSGANANSGESGYVGYEMAVRALETRIGGIVGASGCFYAIRAHLHRAALPNHLSRDFAAALIAREHGYRSVSVDEALCLVPRTPSLRREYRRKVRTITQGIATLWYKRHLMSPLREGVFAWMLISHKACRWAVPWALSLAVVGLALLASEHLWAQVILAGLMAMAVLAGGGAAWPEDRRMPRVLEAPASLAGGNLAAMHSLIRVLRGVESSTWEPTRREVVISS